MTRNPIVGVLFARPVKEFFLADGIEGGDDEGHDSKNGLHGGSFEGPIAHRFTLQDGDVKSEIKYY